jgi:ribosome-associated protein
MDVRPRALAEGSLLVTSQLTIPATEIHTRVTTSGGPGGQHANRTLSKVIVTFDVESSRTLDDRSRERLLERLGPLVRASASESRSQVQNREAALVSLARRIAEGLREEVPRRATRPTKSSVHRRLDDKRRRSSTKMGRRIDSDD